MDRQQEALVREHMSLAYSIAAKVWRQAPHALEMDEMKAIALLGLVDSVARWPAYCAKNNFDPARLEYLRPYAQRRILGTVMDALRSSDWATRSLRTRSKMLQDAGLSAGASTAEMAKKSGLTEKVVRETVRDLAARPVSLEAEALDIEGLGDVEATSAERRMLGEVGKVFATLAEVCQLILSLHYYLNVDLKAVAAYLELPDALVVALHAEAVVAVREALVLSVEGSAGQP